MTRRRRAEGLRNPRPVVTRPSLSDVQIVSSALCVSKCRFIRVRSYWSTKTKGRHCYTDDQIFQRQRKVETSRSGQKRKRGGGSEGWVATRAMLKQMCIDMRVTDRVVFLLGSSPNIKNLNFLLTCVAPQTVFMAFVSLSSPSLYSPGYSRLQRGLLRHV